MSEEQSGRPDKETIPIAREEVEVSRRIHESGRIRVRKAVRERDAIINEPVLREEGEVKRITINRAIEEPMEARYEGDVLVIPVVEEVLVVRKQLMLKEEIHIRRRSVAVQHTERLRLRSEEVFIERLPPDASDNASKQRCLTFNCSAQAGTRQQVK